MQWKQIKIFFLGIILIGIILVLIGIHGYSIGIQYGISSIKNQSQQQFIPKIEEKKFKSSRYTTPYHRQELCNATKWKETTGNATDDKKYNFYAHVVNTFATHGIQLLLNQGSLLGARRHFGMIPWDEQDVDFMAFSTNTTTIEYVLKNVLKLHFGQNRDGEGPGNTGFGYHVTPKLGRYLDLWLFGPINSTHSGCVGVENGCKRWYTKYKWKNNEPPYFENGILLSDSCSRIPFGQWLFPSPHNVYEVLNKQFYSKAYLISDFEKILNFFRRSFGIEDEIPAWSTECFDRNTNERWKCAESERYEYVRTNASIHTLIKGKTTIASFRVANGTYSLLLE